MGLFPSSHGGETPTLLGPLERANLNNWITYVSVTEAVYTPVITVCQWEIREIWTIKIVSVHAQTTSFSSSVSGLYILYHNFYCTLFCYLPLTNPDLKCAFMYIYSYIMYTDIQLLLYSHRLSRPLLSSEEAPFKNTWKSGKNKNMVLGPETKNDYAGEDQQQFTGLDWTGLDWTEQNIDFPVIEVSSL
jgi:hypothetical protein